MRTIRSYMTITAVVLPLAALPAQAVDSADLYTGKFDATSKKERDEIARDLRDRIDKLAQYLPTQKPQESAWLAQENEAIEKLGLRDQPEAYLSRTMRLSESPEFQHDKLQSALAEIRNALTCAGDPTTSLSREMMCWSVGSFLLTDKRMFDDSITILLKAGRLPRTVEKNTIIGPESLGFGYTYDVLGRGIQRYIVIPYLKSQVK